MRISKNVACPACGTRLYRFEPNNRDLIYPICPVCKEPIRVARSSQAWTGRLVLAAILLIGVASYRPGVPGRWILGIVTAGTFAGIMAASFVPLKFERGLPSEPQFNYLTSIIVVAFSLFVMQFFFFGGFYFLIGGKPMELQEYLDILSTPVAFLEKGFLITPSSGFLDLCGTMLGNSFIYGALILICYRTVRIGFKRGEVAQMDLSGTSVKNDEE